MDFMNHLSVVKVASWTPGFGLKAFLLTELRVKEQKHRGSDCSDRSLYVNTQRDHEVPQS